MDIKKCAPGKELCYSLSQHIGKCAEPVVRTGEKICMGQKIARADGKISANILSSVSGEVADVKAGSHIAVKNDGMYTPVKGYGQKRSIIRMSEKEILKRIYDAGVVGMGGAGFPAHVKLACKNNDNIRLLIINGAECEPYISPDFALMVSESSKILSGILVLLRLYKNASAVIAIEDNKKEAADIFLKKVKHIKNIKVKLLNSRYPQGAERQIIYSVAGEKIGMDILPADRGYMVCNVSTVKAINDAVCESIPLTERIVTVTGDAVRSPCNLKVKTGTGFDELILAAGGFKGECKKIITGGPMMGKAVYDMNSFVTKTTSALICFLKDEVSVCRTTPCIRCGRCVSACPNRLMPLIMAEYALNNDYEAYIRIGGMKCMECGKCTYVCPAKRSLTQMFTAAKQSIKGRGGNSA